MYHFYLAILSANRQINVEAGKTLSENLFVKLTTNGPTRVMNREKIGLPVMNLERTGLPVVAEDDLASRVSYSAAELTLTLGTEARENYPTLMFAGDDINTFCRILLRLGLYQSWPVSLLIAITGDAPTTTSISKLLEPFRRLHSMTSVRITGQMEVEYKSKLIAGLLKEAPETDVLYQELQNVMEESDEATSGHDFAVAISRFQRAWEDNQDNYVTNVPVDAILKCGNLRGQSIYTAYYVIRLALSTKLAIIYLRLKKYSEAHAWINAGRSRSSYPQEAGGAEHASRCWIAAQSSEGLGLVKQAIEEMEEAVHHDPDDSKLSEELVRLKRKM